jgi:DNA-binding transcriptional regulator LsrR (DeoR family)
MGSLRGIDEAVVVRACEMFVTGAKNGDILEAVREELRLLNDDRTVTREDVYRLLTLGREARYFTFTPPERVALQTRVANAFDVTQSRVHVANSRSIDVLASTAAKLLVDLIRELGGKHGGEVHVGLGGGFTTRLVSWHLATQLRAVEGLPKLVLHALSTGFDPHGHHTAPVSFFGFFEGIVPRVDYVGLFAPPVVETEQYDQTIRRTSVKESFEARERLHLVVTSLGSAKHDHGDFYKFMQLGTKRGLKALEKAGWVGDVQYRPYSATGPITGDTEIRAVALLELDELMAMASSGDKHVVVVAGPSTLCTASRTNALRPLLEAPKLRLWSHIVMDMVTATELLEGT